MPTSSLTEDQVRDQAKVTLGFDQTIAGVQMGTGQLTTFNNLGFTGVADKPDGWYLPDNTADPAIVLEVKASTIHLKQTHINELLKNSRIVRTKYKHCVGILWNGDDIRVFVDEVAISDVSSLQNKEHYLALLTTGPIDKEEIYLLTARINNCLHFKLKIKSLKNRMVFTACALVAERFGVNLTRLKGTGYPAMKAAITSCLTGALAPSIAQNGKINILIDRYEAIDFDSEDNALTKEATDEFIDNVLKISASINNANWRGEDVMGIFFNEFSRYQGKTDEGQVFTPDHITSFMYRLLGVGQNDRVLDATCGSGAFLTKAMAYMIAEAGGFATTKAKQILRTQIYGIEFDKEIYALACANMLIHKDGKSNLTKLDTRTAEASEWIKNEPMKPENGGKPITKVLMNPPFENKYGCMQIVENVLNSVPEGTLCGFILPEKKLEKVSRSLVEKILRHHRLTMIVKLPEEIFIKVGVTTSIFVFEAGKPQNDQDIFACYMEEDGLETVKNQGRHDTKNRWSAIEDYWIDVCQKKNDPNYRTVQWLKPGFGEGRHLSYQKPQKSFEIFEEDFNRVAMDSIIYSEHVDVAEFSEKVAFAAMYGSEVISDD